MSTEYNDFGFTAMDADELAAIDTKIIEKTTTATDVINKLDNFVRPLLENLAKDSDKDYIYWPNRVDIINKKLKELDEIQKNLQSDRDKFDIIEYSNHRSHFLDLNVSISEMGLEKDHPVLQEYENGIKTKQRASAPKSHVPR